MYANTKGCFRKWRSVKSRRINWRIRDRIIRRHLETPFIRATPCFSCCAEARAPFFPASRPPRPSPPPPLAGDGNIPASNTSAFRVVGAHTRVPPKQSTPATRNDDHPSPASFATRHPPLSQVRTTPFGGAAGTRPAERGAEPEVLKLAGRLAG